MLVKIGPLVSKLVQPIAQVYRMEAKEINNVLVEQACSYLQMETTLQVLLAIKREA